MTNEELAQKKQKDAAAYKKACLDAEFSKPATLQMTSLMDIFTNVLLYLLMSYASAPMDIQQNDENTLPWSTTKIELADTVAVTVTTRALIVNRKKIAPIDKGQVDASLKKDKQANQYLIEPLLESLKEQVAQKKRIAKHNSSVKFDGLITIVADQSTPFRLLAEVMYTAGQAEFSKFKFAVVKKNE